MSAVSQTDGKGVMPDEVLNKVQVEQANTIQRIAKEIIVATGEVGKKYLELVLFIRKNEVLAPLVRAQLGPMGFKKTRVSEILRVAYAGKDVFSKYEARLIGFDRALMLARATGEGNKVESTEVGRQLVESGALEQKDLKNAEAEAEPVETDKKKKKSFNFRKQLAALMVRCPRATAYRFEDIGWDVTITKIEDRPSASVQPSDKK